MQAEKKQAKNVEDYQEIFSTPENYQLDRSIYKYLVRYFVKDNKMTNIKFLSQPNTHSVLPNG